MPRKNEKKKISSRAYKFIKNALSKYMTPIAVLVNCNGPFLKSQKNQRNSKKINKFQRISKNSLMTAAKKTDIIIISKTNVRCTHRKN